MFFVYVCRWNGIFSWNSREQELRKVSLPPNLVPESFVEVHVDRLRTEFDMVCGATACQSAEQFAKNTRSIIHSVQCSVAG